MIDDLDPEARVILATVKLLKLFGYPPGKQWPPGVADQLRAMRRSVEHAAAEKIRALDGCDPAGGFAGYDEGMEIAAAWIDPEPPKPQTGFRWHPLSECEDETGCPIHGRDDSEPTGPEDIRPGSPDGRSGYAGESERLPDGSCPDWCPCHRLRAQMEQP